MVLINPNDYVSHKIAKQLVDAKIIFDESCVVWYFWDEPKGELKYRHETKENFCKYFPEYSLPAPSLIEILNELGGDYSTKMDAHETARCYNAKQVFNSYDKIRGDTFSNTRVNAAAKMYLVRRKTMEQKYLPVEWKENRLVFIDGNSTHTVCYNREGTETGREKIDRSLNIITMEKRVNEEGT